MLTIPLYDDTPKRGVPLVTYSLILVCVAVFLWQEELPPGAAKAATLSYGMIPAILFGYAELPLRLQAVPGWATLFTSAFLHGGWLHLSGNMLYLWLFGRAVEAALGPVRFLVFYLACAAAAALVQGLIEPQAEVPMIGASGAIAGVLGAYLILYPRANVAVLFWIFIFVRVVTVPAVLLLGLWFVFQLLNGLVAVAGEPGVAFWAHVGGFVFGMIAAPFFCLRRSRVLQPPRTQAFSVLPPREARRQWGRGSVPSAGPRRRPHDRV